MSNINPNAKTYAILADSVYWDVRKHLNNPADRADTSKSNWTPVPAGWELIKEVSGSGDIGRVLNKDLEGFTARAYKNGNEIVIAYAGTHQPDMSGDINEDVKLGAGDRSIQANQAAIFYHEVKHMVENSDTPNATIKFTGHSLGGGLAGLMGVYFNKEAVIFDHAPFKLAAMFDSPLVAEYTEEDLKYDPTKTPYTFQEIKEKFIQFIKDNHPINPENLLKAGLGFIPAKIAQEAGDRLAAGNTKDEVIQALRNQALNNQREGKGFTEIDKNLLDYEYSKDYDARTSKLTAIATAGEFLDEASFLGGHFVKNNLVLYGENEVDGIRNGALKKHSMTLLTNALLNEDFEYYSTLREDKGGKNGANLNTLNMLLDENFYTYDQASGNQNFLTKLVRSHIGTTLGGGIDYATGDVDKSGTPVKYKGKSLLSAFGQTLKTLATALQPYDMNSKYHKAGYDALIASAIEWHYHQDIDKYHGRNFVDLRSNALRFTTAQADDLLGGQESKTTSYAQKWITEAYLDVAGIEKTEVSTNYDQWTVVVNDSRTNALDSDKSQILITFGSGAIFTAGDKDDLLFGYHGSDTLNGGKGNDILVGGRGFDTYYVEGHDVIYDSDGQGMIAFTNSARTTLLNGRFEQISDDMWYAKDTHGKITYTATRVNDDLVVFYVQGREDTATIKTGY